MRLKTRMSVIKPPFGTGGWAAIYNFLDVNPSSFCFKVMQNPSLSVCERPLSQLEGMFTESLGNQGFCLHTA